MAGPIPHSQLFGRRTSESTDEATDSLVGTRQILEGLATLHPFVMLANARGQIAWMSPRLREHLCPSGAAGEYTVSCHSGDPGQSGRLEALLTRHLPDPSQLQPLRDALRERRHAERVRLDLATSEGQIIRVQASAFLVEADDSDEKAGGPYTVIIARVDQPDIATEPQSDATKQLAAILDGAPDGVVATDHSGFITYANPAVRLFLGQDPIELIGKPIGLFLPEQDDSQALHEKLRDPSGWNGEEFPVARPDGSRAWISVSTRPLELEGRTKGLVTYLRDVTKRREMQEALSAKNGDLESYVDAVAHDLRSPLVSLLGFTRLLRQDYENALDETGHHFLDRIEQSGRTMESLIHDLLELSRIRPTGSGPLCDPRAVLQHLAAELKLRLDEQDLTLVVPEAPPMMLVESTRLYQVFSNLIGNALAHMGPCEHPRVKIEVLEDARFHHIVVSDNGRGIPAEDHERIFEIFQTGRRPSQDGDRSSGIGLAIVKKIAETHGGRVWVTSEVGAGASFHVSFPRPVATPLVEPS